MMECRYTWCVVLSAVVVSCPETLRLGVMDAVARAFHKVSGWGLMWSEGWLSS